MCVLAEVRPMDKYGFIFIARTAARLLFLILDAFFKFPEQMSLRVRSTFQRGYSKLFLIVSRRIIRCLNYSNLQKLTSEIQ